MLSDVCSPHPSLSDSWSRLQIKHKKARPVSTWKVGLSISFYQSFHVAFVFQLSEWLLWISLAPVLHIIRQPVELK